jgi:hypothetical protein
MTTPCDVMFIIKFIFYIIAVLSTCEIPELSKIGSHLKTLRETVYGNSKISLVSLVNGAKIINMIMLLMMISLLF